MVEHWVTVKASIINWWRFHLPYEYILYMPRVFQLTGIKLYIFFLSTLPYLHHRVTGMRPAHQYACSLCKKFAYTVYWRIYIVGVMKCCASIALLPISILRFCFNLYLLSLLRYFHALANDLCTCTCKWINFTCTYVHGIKLIWKFVWPLVIGSNFKIIMQIICDKHSWCTNNVIHILLTVQFLRDVRSNGHS